VLSGDVRDPVTDKMLGGVDRKSSEQNKKSEQGQGKPLVFGFHLEQASPPSSHT
jgi:hypothetical protein